MYIPRKIKKKYFFITLVEIATKRKSQHGGEVGGYAWRFEFQQHRDNYSLSVLCIVF